MRLDTDSIVVLDVNAATYDSTKRSVTRNRRTQEERDALEQQFANVVDFDLDEILDN